MNPHYSAARDVLHVLAVDRRIPRDLPQVALDAGTGHCDVGVDAGPAEVAHILGPPTELLGLR